MYTQQTNPKESKRAATANVVAQKMSANKKGIELVDNRSKRSQIIQKKESIPSQTSQEDASVIQRFPWGKSVATPVLAAGLGLLGDSFVPGVGGMLGMVSGALLGLVGGHWFDTLPIKPTGQTPRKPIKMTDTQVQYSEDVDEHKDRLGANTRYSQLSNFEQDFLNIHTNDKQMTSDLHPQTLNDLGMRLSTLTSTADASRGQTKMSPMGKAYDKHIYEKLVYDGAMAKATKTHQNSGYEKEILGELHHLPNQRQKLIQDLEEGNAKGALYLELNQEIQPLVNEYSQQVSIDDTTPMPALLRGYLRRVDNNFRSHNPKYPDQGTNGTYEHLVEQYVQGKKRVVFADSPYAKGIPHDENFEHNREAAMNQAMYEQIVTDQAQVPSSYAVLTGQAHVGNNRHGMHWITGLKNRLGI